MRPTEIAAALRVCIQARQPAFIHGAPGIGKSAIVHQVAAQLDYEVIDVRLSQMDPVDLRGIPSIRGNKTVWTAPDWWPTKPKQLIFWDELPNAAHSVMAASYQTILDNRMGSHLLPPDTAQVAAGNMITDHAMVNSLPTPLKNRFTHFVQSVYVPDWEDWAVSNNVDYRVLSFIRLRPTLLAEFEQVNGDSGVEEKKKKRTMKDVNAFATPRTWCFVSRILGHNPGAHSFNLFAGTVGEGAATEFCEHLECHDKLPNLDLVLANPEKAKVPDLDEAGVLYALATGLATKATPDNFDRVITYTNRIPKEFQIMTIKDAVRRNHACANTSSFAKWGNLNKDFIHA